LHEAAPSNWPSATGTVTKSVVEQTDLSEKPRFRPGIYYTFSVGDKQIESHGAYVDDRTFATTEEAAEFIQKFPQRSNTTVYYNPAKPEQSVLVLGTTMGAWLWLASPFPLAGLGAVSYGGWLVLRRDLKKKKIPSEFDI